MCIGENTQHKRCARHWRPTRPHYDRARVPNIVLPTPHLLGEPGLGTNDIIKGLRLEWKEPQQSDCRDGSSDRKMVAHQCTGAHLFAKHLFLFHKEALRSLTIVRSRTRLHLDHNEHAQRLLRRAEQMRKFVELSDKFFIAVRFRNGNQKLVSGTSFNPPPTLS